MKYLLFENPVDQVRLLVVMRAEDDVETDVLEGHQLLVLVLLDARRVEDGSVVLADTDVGALVLVLREEMTNMRATAIIKWDNNFQT